MARSISGIVSSIETGKRAVAVAAEEVMRSPAKSRSPVSPTVLEKPADIGNEGVPSSQWHIARRPVRIEAPRGSAHVVTTAREPSVASPSASEGVTSVVTVVFVVSP